MSQLHGILAGLLFLLARVALSNDILTLQTAFNTWIPLVPTNLAAPSRILHAGALLVDPHYSAEAVMIFGGYGTTIQDDKACLELCILALNMLP